MAMVALDEFGPKSADATCSITTEIVTTVFALAALSSLLIALQVSVACTTLSVGELWRIILSVSAAPAILIGLISAIRVNRALTRLMTTHEELVGLAMIDALTGLVNRPGFDAIAA